jgi:hypothetical protein
MATGQDQSYVVNVVDSGGVHNGIVFDKPADGRVFPRVLKIDDASGVTSWLTQDDGSGVPQAESDDGDYSDLSVYGITWHHKR